MPAPSETRPATEARIQAMAKLLNRTLDAVEAPDLAEEAKEVRFFKRDLAADLAAAYGDLQVADQARLAALCPRVAKLFRHDLPEPTLHPRSL